MDIQDVWCYVEYGPHEYNILSKTLKTPKYHHTVIIMNSSGICYMVVLLLSQYFVCKKCIDILK